MGNFPKKLTKKLIERKQNHSFRELREPKFDIDFSSNDYLGFAKEDKIYDSVGTFLKANGFQQNGATGSRLLSGHNALYTTAEERLKNFYKSQAALIFNSGYDANLAFFSSIPQRGDFIFYDELIHASIRDGIRMSNAKSYKFKHNDFGTLEHYITTQKGSAKNVEVYIVTESVFSMDGDCPHLKELVALCLKRKYRLIIDEAHAVGVFGTKGEGLGTKFTDNVFARIVTFGKAWGCHGAAVLGQVELKEYLINFARSFIYTTALPPHAIGSIIVAHNYAMDKIGMEIRKKLLENINFFISEYKRLELENYFIFIVVFFLGMSKFINLPIFCKIMILIYAP